MEDEKAFFFRGESGQSGDSISVCCHKMAGQLFGSLATIEWKCSTPLKPMISLLFVTMPAVKESSTALVAIGVGKTRHGRGQVVCRGPTRCSCHVQSNTGLFVSARPLIRPGKA